VGHNDLDSFSAFLETVDPQVAQQRVTERVKEIQKHVELTDQESDFLRLLGDNGGQVSSRKLAEQHADVGILEVARVLEALQARGLVQVTGSGDSELVAITERGSKAIK
jgi:Fe2+ or Zn2+ uptake regulation protein